MLIRLSIVTVSMFLIGCSGNGSTNTTDATDTTQSDAQQSDGQPDTTTEDGAVPDQANDSEQDNNILPDEASNDTTTEDTIDDLAEDTKEDDIPDDVDDPDVIEPEEYTEDFLEKYCESSCDKIIDCNLYDGADCSTSCMETGKTNDASVKAMMCVDISQDCAAIEICMGANIPDDPDCVSICSDLDDCGGFPSSVAGANAKECNAWCSGSAFGAPDIVAAVKPCVAEKAAACDTAGIAFCIAGEELCNNVCSGVDSCDNIPGIFDTIPSCMQSCLAYTSGQAIAAMGCIGIGEEMGCAVQTDCFPPPNAMAEGAIDYCKVILDLCKDSDGFDMPNDPQICAWMMTGLTAIMPQVDFAQGTTCATQINNCNDSDQLFECLIP